MVEGRHIHFESHGDLDSEERRRSQPADPLIDLVLERHPRTVADVGVGTGYFALPLARRLRGGRVLGLDTEPRMLEILRQRASEQGLAGRVEPKLMIDPETLPLLSQSVEGVILVNLYHELEDRHRYMAEVRRVLAPGGRVVVCDWRPDGSTDRGPRPEHRIAEATCREELGEARFSSVREHQLYRDHWVVSAEAGE